MARYVTSLLCSARNNQFLIAARSNVAITYNDISVLENFHCAETFTIAHSPECGVFEGMEAGQYSHFRKTVVKMILASVRARLDSTNVVCDRVTFLVRMMRWHRTSPSILSMLQS